MFYRAKLTYYDEVDYTEQRVNLLICADGFKDVISKLSDYYGEEQLDEIYISPFSPEDMLIFEEKETDLYDEVILTLGAKVIW